MRIRIPNPVNQALDTVGRRQRLVSVAVVSAAAGALTVAAFMDQLAAVSGAVGVGALLLLGAMSRARSTGPGMRILIGHPPQPGPARRSPVCPACSRPPGTREAASCRPR